LPAVWSEENAMSPRINRRTLLEVTAALTAGGVAGFGGVTLLGAQTAGQTAGQPLWEPPELRAEGRELSTRIRAAYSHYDLAGRAVKLRGYNGLPVGPTLRIRAGDTLRLHLVNDLPWEPGGLMCGGNIPHAMNTTNMHVHGLHVSPRQPGDDILLHLAPKGPQPPDTLHEFHYAYTLPDNHPPGTYFYHAHYHGAVALQVASGMAGTLVVEGAVDDIPEIRRCRQRVLVVQSQCVGPDGTCETFDLLAQSGPTYVNGQLKPVIAMMPGEVQRWRIVNATHDRLLRLSLQEPVSAVLLCADGIPLPEAKPLPGSVNFIPGNRLDLLVRAPRAPGRYGLFGRDTVGLLATVQVLDGEPKDDPLYSGALPGALKPITESEVTYGRRLDFGMIGAPPAQLYTINGQPFSCDTPWNIPLGAVEEWEIYNETNDPHPFHIHVNPFQMVGGGNVPPGVWLDTVELVPNTRTRFRTRFLDYTGTFVFHCHTLPHEDMGMMQAITVAERVL